MVIWRCAPDLIEFWKQDSGKIENKIEYKIATRIDHKIEARLRNKEREAREKGR